MADAQEKICYRRYVVPDFLLTGPFLFPISLFLNLSISLILVNRFVSQRTGEDSMHRGCVRRYYAFCISFLSFFSRLVLTTRSDCQAEISIIYVVNSSARNGPSYVVTIIFVVVKLDGDKHRRTLPCD